MSDQYHWGAPPSTSRGNYGRPSRPQNPRGSTSRDRLYPALGATIDALAAHPNVSVQRAAEIAATAQGLTGNQVVGDLDIETKVLTPILAKLDSVMQELVKVNASIMSLSDRVGDVEARLQNIEGFVLEAKHRSSASGRSGATSAAYIPQGKVE